MTTSKMNVVDAEKLCQDAVFIAGEGYVCPTGSPSLVETAIRDSDLEFEEELLQALIDDFTGTWNSNPEVQDAIDVNAANFLVGADKHDKSGGTWGEALVEGKDLFIDCWDDSQAESLGMTATEYYDGIKSGDLDRNGYRVNA